MKLDSGGRFERLHLSSDTRGTPRAGSGDAGRSANAAYAVFPDRRDGYLCYSTESDRSFRSNGDYGLFLDGVASFAWMAR